MDNSFVITEFISSLLVGDARGKRTEYRSRYASAFIIPLRGRLRFTVGERIYDADAEHPLFLPEGVGYVNECLEDAESVMFNFRIASEAEAMSCVPIGEELARACYTEISRESYRGTRESGCRVLSCLCRLAAALLREAEATPSPRKRLLDAICAEMRARLGEPSLSVAGLALERHVSEVGLRKLFSRELGISPRAYLTELRMQRAALLVREHRAIREIAEAVGYSDVYQFSRAYKKYFGYSPTKTAERIC